MHRHCPGVALPTVSGEHKALLNITTRGTHEGVMLEAMNGHGVVWDDLHQDHRGPADHAAHQIKPTTIAHQDFKPRPLRMSDLWLRSGRCVWGQGQSSQAVSAPSLATSRRRERPSWWAFGVVVVRRPTALAGCPGDRKSDHDRSQAQRGEWLMIGWRFADRHQ
jgi:hypothetical protein